MLHIYKIRQYGGGEGLLSFSMIINSKLLGFDLIIISLFFLIFCNSPIFPFFDSSLNVGLQKNENLDICQKRPYHTIQINKLTK